MKTAYDLDLMIDTVEIDGLVEKIKNVIEVVATMFLLPVMIIGFLLLAAAAWVANATDK